MNFKKRWKNLYLEDKIISGGIMNKDKLYQILMSKNIVKSIKENQDELLKLIPELKDMIGFEHKHPHHHLDVWEHTLLALRYSEEDFQTRLVLLLHDIGKPHSFQEGEIRHFKGHPIKSSQMTNEILRRLNFSEEEINKICYLIKEHDTPISNKDIEENIELSIKRFKVQYCDALAHNPTKLKKRIEYLLLISDKLNIKLSKEQAQILMRYKSFDKQ